MQPIRNADLILEQIPSSQSDWKDIEQFALTFDGYQASRSFETCAEIANNRRGSTVSELRTSLFFEQRRWRHFGATPDQESMVYIRSIIEQIRQKLVSELNRGQSAP